MAKLKLKPVFVVVRSRGPGVPRGERGACSLGILGLLEQQKDLSGSVEDGGVEANA